MRMDFLFKNHLEQKYIILLVGIDICTTMRLQIKLKKGGLVK